MQLHSEIVDYDNGIFVCLVLIYETAHAFGHTGCLFQPIGSYS